MEKFYRHRAMRFLRTECDDQHQENNDLVRPESQAYLRKFRRYSTLKQVDECLRKRQPVSVVIYSNHNLSMFSIFCFVNKKKDKENWMVHRVVVTEQGILEDTYGYNYYRIRLDETGSVCKKCVRPILPGVTFHTYGVLLPDHWTARAEGDRYVRYAVVGEDWEHMSSSNVWTQFL